MEWGEVDRPFATTRYLCRLAHRNHLSDIPTSRQLKARALVISQKTTLGLNRGFRIYRFCQLHIVAGHRKGSEADLREGGGFLKGSSAPPARKLVLGWPFHVIDNHDFDGAFSRFQSQSQLFLDCCEQVRDLCVIQWRREAA